nr:hypothetical protein [Tanacetum cinerariifolium]
MKTCRRGICATVALISWLENMWDPPFHRGLSLGKESLTSVPQRTFSGDKSPGKPIPSDKSPGKAGICRWGRGLIRLNLKQHFNGQCTRSGGVSLAGYTAICQSHDDTCRLSVGPDEADVEG